MTKKLRGRGCLSDGKTVGEWQGGVCCGVRDGVLSCVECDCDCRGQLCAHAHRAEQVEGSVLFGGRVRVGDVSRTQSE